MPVNGKSRFCKRCGKPVFFAERKTSLGEDWHPTCLSCEKCTKVLAPGQHAEHKGLPFCNPCYQSLYGPQILGYGSNVSTAANFSKRYSQNNNNNNGTQRNTTSKPLAGHAMADMLAKLEEYNSHLTNGRSQCKLSSLQEESGTTVIQGPLRIYWGLDSPIQLKQTDDVSPVPAPSTSTTWRHSYFQAVTNGNISPEKPEAKPKIPESPARSKLTRGLDDSALLSPTSEASPVVLRRNRGLRKFNTVAYRGDQGNRWKRASINGHIYNHDTRVFVPVVGSCTSVTVTSAMPTADVIKTLLEKFKVENQAYEFSLHIVPDKGEPRLLRDSDFPLVERLSIGCDEKLGKIFIREKTIPEVPVEAWKTLTLPEAVERLPPPDVSLTEVTELTELTEKKEQLPEEVEQLANLPEAVLRGFLQKFKNDEEQEVKKIQRKYELAKYMVRKRMKESQA